jgi:hypothetical protein
MTHPGPYRPDLQAANSPVDERLDIRADLLAHSQVQIANGLVPYDATWITPADREAMLKERRRRASWFLIHAAIAVGAVFMLSVLLFLLLILIVY